MFGGTGNTGKYVLSQAVDAGWNVVAFVRNSERIPAELRSRLTAFTGDLNDVAAVAEAVHKHKPHAIIDASSALPTNPRGQPQNNADRTKFLPAIYEALRADGRIADCSVIVLSGQVLPEPGGRTPNCIACTILCLIRCCAPSMWARLSKTLSWLFHDTAPDFRFVYIRAGMLVPNAASRGTVVPLLTDRGSPTGPVTCSDMAAAMLVLAGYDSSQRQWARKAVYMNYATPTSSSSNSTGNAK